ncbi:hypothetical protein [Caulobacter hibisci]|uniref:Uncharacterized protein n=1 Tax=Caulobacter hibisci TaxID=2035993 RepID=A0ABS0SY39_9CAUL|nr:hypothetical protein [Caulobacter hibisci]MBI1684151.1 hypothetical protein [Caulobacter hibisci]
MSTGKDPQTADGLGGVHKVNTPRPSAPVAPSDAEAVVVARGPLPGSDGLVDDPDQIAKVVHTVPAPVETASDANARESTLRPIQTPEAPFQDARIAPEGPSAWSAEKKPGA